MVAVVFGVALFGQNRPDRTPQQSVQFVTVDKDVMLEVVDWGGSGRPLILLAGLGGTAHVFDKFAPKLTSVYHVYGITRRGFGKSSAPPPMADNYSADRLSDDVLSVIEQLKLNKPVLVGHSIAGEELSSIGSRHPEKVAGLIYLDAAYSYAYYDPVHGGFDIDLAETRRKIEQFQGLATVDTKNIQDLLETTLPVFERALRDRLDDLTPADDAAVRSGKQWPAVTLAVLAGEQEYTDIKPPILAIFAVPHHQGNTVDAATRAALDAREEAIIGAQIKAFKAGVPSAKVIIMPHANHNVFDSNEADVVREMHSFISTLP